MLKRAYAWVTGAALTGLMAAQPVLAAVPEEVEDVFTGAAADFATVVAYGWAAFIAIRGGMVLFPIVSRIVSKAVGR